MHQIYEPLPPSTLDESSAAQLAELFRTLADPSRLRILASLLVAEQTVTGLAVEVGISEPAVSYHLRGLRQMHIVHPRRQGREVFYSLEDDHVADLLRRGWEHIRHL